MGNDSIVYPEYVPSNQSFSIDFVVWKVYSQTGSGRFAAEVRVLSNSAHILFPRKKTTLRAFFKLVPVKGDEYSITARIVHNPKYGESIIADNILDTPKIPQSVKSAIDFLTGHVKNLGKSVAKQIVEQLGANAIVKIKNDPEILRTLDFKRKPKEQVLNNIIGISYFGSYISNLSKQLSVIKAPETVSILLYNKFGINTLEAIKKDPYQIAELSPKYFPIADAWLHYLDPSGSSISLSSHRYQTAVWYAIWLFTSQKGSLSVPENDLEKLVCSPYFLPTHGSFPFHSNNVVTKAMFQEAVKELVDSKKIFVNYDSVYLKNDFILESDMVNAIQDREKLHFEKLSHADTSISIFEKEKNIKLSQSQKQAVINSLNYPISILTGGPGTGKTLSVASIVYVAKSLFGEDNVILAAPTGKAARRLSEVSSFPANTLHRTLGIRTFAIEPTKVIHSKILVIDESSMITAQMFLATLRSLSDDVRLVLVGDNNQLPAIGKGNVLADLINSKIIPIVKLDKVFRQKDGSLIPKNAFLMKNGIGLTKSKSKSIIFDSNYNFSNKRNNSLFLEAANPTDTLKKSLSAFVSLWKKYKNSPDSIMVLTPKKGGLVGVDRLNREIQKMVNPLTKIQNTSNHFLGADEQLIYKADSVMQIENDSRTGITNGSLGKVLEVSSKQVVIKFFGYEEKIKYSLLDAKKYLVLGYAITIHKSQGSENKNVIQIIDKSHMRMLSRPLVYTGYTRAEENHIFVGQIDTLNKALLNNAESLRPSNVPLRLQEEQR